MRLIKINDKLWINPEMVTSVSRTRTKADPHGREEFYIALGDSAAGVYWTGMRNELFDALTEEE